MAQFRSWKIWGGVGLLSVLALATAQTGRKTLTLAVDTSITGEFALVGEDVSNAAQLCFEQYRAELRIPRVTLNLKIFDDRGNENGAREVAAQMVADPNIFAMVGQNISNNILITMGTLEKANLAYGIIGTSKRLTESGAKGITRFVTNDDFLGEATAQYVAETLGAQSIFLVHDNSQNSISKAKELAEEIRKRKVAIVGLLGTDKEAEVADLVKQIKASKTQVVFYSGYQAIGTALSLTLEREKVTSKLIGTNTLDTPGFFQAAGRSVIGFEYATVGMPAKLYPGGGASFARQFLKRFGKEPGYRAAATCDATRAALLALQSSMQNGEPYSRGAVQTALRDSEFEGITGNIKFDSKGNRTKQTVFIFKVGEDLVPRLVFSLSK